MASKSTRITQKALAEQAKENDMKLSKDGKQYLADSSLGLTADEASTILEEAIQLTKDLKHKTVKKEYIEMILQLRNAVAETEDSSKKMSKKGAGELAHAQECNMGEVARNALSSVEKNKAEVIINAVCSLVKAEKKKTVSGDHVNTVLKIWSTFE
jgi:histone H3/H4